MMRKEESSKRELLDMNKSISSAPDTGVTVQKQKLILLAKMLYQLTDENNPLTGKELMNMLQAHGIKIERKTLYDDIATLSGSGLEIEITKKGHSHAYYIGERLFTDEELYVLVDAVASSKFLTVRKSSELIRKLQKLTSASKAKSLRRQVFVENRVRTFNESIYYTINQINEAVFAGKMLEFKYYAYDLNRKRKFKHDGEIYQVSPYYLVWKGDNYYLICHSEKREKIVYFRVDRMSSVKVSDRKRTVLSVDEQEIAKSLMTAFDMYSGTPERVTIKADNSLIDVVMDRFGEKTAVTRVNDSSFTFKADVQISPTFWGWLFSFGDKMKVTAPKWVVNQAAEEAGRLNDMYKKQRGKAHG